MSAPYNPPAKGEDFVLRISLQDMALPGSFKANPFIENGDFKVDKDGLGLTNLATLPVVQPAGSVLVVVSLSAAEMTADVVTIVGIDQTYPKQWADFVLSIPTTGVVVAPVPLVLQHDGATTNSLIMNVASDGTFGGAITTQSDNLPSNLIWGSEVGGARGTQIGGGFNGNRDTNSIWFWCDADNTPDAVPDGGSPILIMEGPAIAYEAGIADFTAKVSVLPNIGGKYWGSFGWDSSTTPNLFKFEVGFTGSGSQKDLAFCASDAAEKWRMAYSAGSHFLPGASEALDIGSTTKRVRNTYTSTLTLTQKSAIETDAGKIVTQNVGGPPITVMEAGEVDFGLPPGYRYRVINFGGGMAEAGSLSTDPNEIAFYTDPDFTDTAPVGGGQITVTMSPERVGAFAPLNIYCDSAGAKDYALLGFSADKTTFNFEVGYSTVNPPGAQRDLLFCTRGAAAKWRMAYTAGSHFLPETDNTLDIGSATKKVRKTYTNDLVIPTDTGSISIGAHPTAPDKIFHAPGGLGFGSTGNYFGVSFYNTNINDTVNTETLDITTTGTTYAIFSNKTGTGTARALQIQNWNMGSVAAPAMFPAVTNTQDIGSATKFVRNIFTATMRWLSGTAPGTPVDGDMWFTGTALQMRVGGVTKTITMA